MKLLLSDTQTPPTPTHREIKLLPWRAEIRSWFRSWEFYLILLTALFLRLYQIQLSTFDTDQSDIFRMAYDAVHHGLLVAAINKSSLGAFNPPATVYFLMIPAIFSADPVWGAVETAVLGILGVLLTYAFTRRYYGRLAGTFAGLLCATAVLLVEYARYTWNQNFLLVFLPLFFLVLFWGVVERRRGWLFPAIFLVGLLYQFHGTAILLIAPLLAAWLLAPGTVRWRDLVFGVLSLLVMYAPYILWLFNSHFQDISILLSASGQHVSIDSQAIVFYRAFLIPYPYPFLNSRSYIMRLIPFIDWIRVIMPWLVRAAGVFALGIILWSRRSGQPGSETTAISVWGWVRRYWRKLRADPLRCGLIILLAWQIVPLLLLSRHALPLFQHYLIVLMPGPFILIAILLANAVALFQRYPHWGKVARTGICLLVVLITIGQAAVVGAGILDKIRGRVPADGAMFDPYHNDLESLQRALGRADELAGQRHIGHLYVSTDTTPTEFGLRFLSEHTSTPATTFSDSCWVFPAPDRGPAIMLVGPYSDFAPEIQSGLVHATLLEESPTLSGPPFKIYLVTSPVRATTAQMSYPQDLQFIAARPSIQNGQSSLVLRWKILRMAPASFETTYTYAMTNLDNNVSGNDKTRACTTTALQPGDQLLTAFPVQRATSAPASLNIQVQYYKMAPLIVTTPPGISFLTGARPIQDQTTLRTADGKDSLAIQADGSTS